MYDELTPITLRSIRVLKNRKWHGNIGCYLEEALKYLKEFGCIVVELDVKQIYNDNKRRWEVSVTNGGTVNKKFDRDGFTNFLHEYNNYLNKLVETIKKKETTSLSIHWLESEYQKITSEEKEGEQNDSGILNYGNGCVYFLKIGSFIKIGYASNLQTRMRNYRTHTPSIELLGVLHEEKEIHVHFQFTHLRIDPRREFFVDSEEILNYLSKNMTDIDRETTAKYNAKLACQI